MPLASPPRLTQTGLIISSAAALTTAAGLVLFSGPILAVGISLACLLFVCRHFAARHLEGVEVVRELPRRARAGESFPMRLHLRLGPSFPDSADASFTDPLAPAVREREVSTQGHARHDLRCTGLAHRRGPLPAKPWTLASTWPLGIFLTEQHGGFRDDHATLVLPKPWLPSRLRDRLEILSQESAENVNDPPDPLSEFRYLREFRHGDPVRGIHWPTSLRSGRLQFAETEPPRPKPSLYGIFLHSYEAPGTLITPETYELILRIATGLLMRFQREEIPVWFCQAPGAPVLLRERHEFSSMLDTLALSRRRPLSTIEGTFAGPKGLDGDPFPACDEVFVLGDGPLAGWEEAARARFAHVTCLDPTRLTHGSRPSLRIRALTRS